MDDESSLPPWAPQTRLPFLGHALAYKANPPAFLRHARSVAGPVFRVNLAGLVTTIVSDEENMKLVATAPKSVLSSRDAIADFGFRFTLGDDNVYQGTDLHKQVLKHNVYFSSSDQDLAKKLLPIAMQGIREAFPASGTGSTCPDLLGAMRKAAFIAVFGHFIGEAVLPAGFADDFMIFQDEVEEATAKGVTLPRSLALTLLWGPTKRHRERITRRLAEAIRTSDPDHWGVWLRAVMASEATASGAATGTGEAATATGPAAPAAQGAQGEPLDADGAASLVVGLMFAAHKNPAIAAAQTLLLLFEDHERQSKASSGGSLEGSWLQRVQASLSGTSPSECATQNSTLDACVRETLRLTSHSLGAIRKVRAKDGFLLRAAVGSAADATAPSFIVPANSFIGVSHILPHLDEEVFPASADFRPERFLALSALPTEVPATTGNVAGTSSTVTNYQFTAFSHGVHVCPGQRYALILVKLLVALCLEPKGPLKGADSVVGQIPPMDFTRATLAQRSRLVKVRCR